MTRFVGATDPDASAKLTYEETLNALLGLIGRQVLVLFSGAEGPPFIAGVVSGRLDRGEPDERLQEIVLRSDQEEIETIFFHIGSRAERLCRSSRRVRRRRSGERSGNSSSTSERWP